MLLGVQFPVKIPLKKKYPIYFLFLKKILLLTTIINNILKNIFMKFPEGLLYTKDHEWVKIEGDVAIVGITDFAQKELGDIVYVEVDTIGESLDKEETFGTIEAVKTVSDLYMPLSGEVLEFNEELESAPDVINKDPYGKGWIVKIKLSDPGETESLLRVEEYKNLVGA